MSEVRENAEEDRKRQGKEIADLARIDKEKGVYLVPSQHNPRQTKYQVRYGRAPTCNCIDFETRGRKCKHIYAVEHLIEKLINDEPLSITRNPQIAKTRKTYPQNWPAYNAAQNIEKRQFQSLLFDLCKRLPSHPNKRGKRRLPVSDAIFSAVFKVYCATSARRFVSDLCESSQKGYIARVPHFNSVLNVFDAKGTEKILLELIEQASIPLRSLETKFAVDSTGFAFSRFVRWFDIKYNRFTSEKQWVKAHICAGVKTNVITAIEILERDAADSPQLPSLVEKTAKNFAVTEVMADKAYSGRQEHAAVARVGATPYIAFKSNATGGVGGLFAKMFHLFQFKREEFLEHYHQRSNVESSIMMIKTKFGDSVRSKTEKAAKNEVLAKVLCHNICCLISAIHELQIEVDFDKSGVKS